MRLIWVLRADGIGHLEMKKQLATKHSRGNLIRKIGVGVCDIFVGGAVSTGALRGAMTGAVTGAIFAGIGSAFDASSGFFAEGGLGHMVSHGLTGGVLSDLQGGNFGHGFWSAGLTKAANINGMVGTTQGAGWDALRIVVAAMVGGTISKITGGKFGNGAVSAAMGQMLNGNQRAEQTEQEKEIAEIKKKLDVKPEMAKALLKKFYPKQAKMFNDVEMTPALTGLATDMLATAMEGSATMNVFSRLLALADPPPFSLKNVILDTGLDIWAGGLDAWDFQVNGHDYSNPQLYHSVTVKVANDFVHRRNEILNGL